MARTGRNMRITVAKAERDALRRALVDVIGAKHVPVRDTFEAFVLDDGFSLGVDFTDEGGLSPEDARDKGVWIELLVDDVEATNAKLREAGVASFDYPPDPDNTYFWLPGGPVFRLGPIEQG